MVDAAKLPVETGVSADAMADAMFGPSIKIVSATFTGDPQSAGIYSHGDTVAPNLTPSDTGVILSTGKASDITNATGDANHIASRTTDTAGVNGDADLNAIAGTQTYDAAIFQADFIPDGSVLTMQITFSSEEYLEYVGSGFNDAVGVWVNGEKALLTVGDGDISINNINPGSNGDLYIDNANDQFNTEMDGFTVTLTLKAPVIPGQVNTIKIAIADGGDASYDSNLLIAGDSIQTAVVATDDSFTVDWDGQTVVDLIGNDVDAAGGTLTITKINGIPVTAGSTVTLPSGLVIMVNGDGTITVVSDPTDTPGDVSFSYEVTNEDGITDVGFVTGDVVPCFVAGTRIDTQRGPIRVEDVEVGDLVLTLDDGWQPVRWHGARQVPSQGTLAQVLIPAGTFGDHGALAVSPQHRLYLTGWRAELYCGEDEVLVKAIHLARAGKLHQDRSGRPVTYHHLMFDRHQIIRAEGMWSESYHPGPTTLADHDPDTRDEILTLFPELARDPAQGYGPIARPEATAQAAALLLA
ncbi:MAG TPA: choice-of-anchor L domain-containing protein [Tabrizicola sp.]|nr:choice-of-anchor L domain-containing protein [Tabrizicola sp.]